jgi:hypothetical protein
VLHEAVDALHQIATGGALAVGLIVVGIALARGLECRR